MPKQKRRYIVEIEANLVVDAFDENAAVKKVERAFAAGRSLGADVGGGEAVWTYAVTPIAPDDDPKLR